jgi:hypothetical protein
MALKPFEVKVLIYAEDIEEAKKVSASVKQITSQTTLVADDLLTYFQFYREQGHKFKPMIVDIMKNGKVAAIKHLPKLMQML